MDNHTQEQRHYNMSQIKSKNTKPEEFVRKYLFANGFRFRKNDKRYAGHPDIVLPKYKTIIFINGCFWHMHDCKDFVLPKSNLGYWIPKLERNKKRDESNRHLLQSDGWHVIIIWECEFKTISDRKLRMEQLIQQLKSQKP